MANSQVLLTTISKALKIGQPLISDHVRNNNYLFSKMKAGKGKDMGRYVIISNKFGRAANVGARAELGTMPDSTIPTYDEFNVPRAYNWGTITISQQSLEVSGDTVGDKTWAITESLAADLEDVFGQDQSRQLYNRASDGVIARVSGSPSVLTATLYAEDFRIPGGSTANGTFGIKYLEPGMKLQAHSAKTGGTTRATVYTVTGIGESDNTITLDAITNLADGDYLTRDGNRGNEYVGLIGSIGDNTNTYLTFDRTNPQYYLWKPVITHNDSAANGTGTWQVLTGDVINRHFTVLESRNKAKINFALTHPNTLNAYADYMLINSKYDIFAQSGMVAGTNQILKLRMGRTVIEVETDWFCPKGILFTIDTSTHKLYSLDSGEMEWINHSTNPNVPNYFAWDQTANNGSWKANAKLFMYPICHAPQKNGSIQGLLGKGV